MSWATGNEDDRWQEVYIWQQWCPGYQPGTSVQYNKLQTIKNFLANALLPVGKTLYVWGGGHNWSDATRRWHQSKWKQWYDSNSSSYNYRYYMDLSEATEQKGLDCLLL